MDNDPHESPCGASGETLMSTKDHTLGTSMEGLVAAAEVDDSIGREGLRSCYLAGSEPATREGSHCSLLLLSSFVTVVVG